MYKIRIDKEMESYINDKDGHTAAIHTYCIIPQLIDLQWDGARHLRELDVHTLTHKHGTKKLGVLFLCV